MGVELLGGEIHVDGTLSISLQRTQRATPPIVSSAPSSLGLLPLCRTEEHPKAPARIRRRGGFFVPLGQDESLWLGFRATGTRAIRVGFGRVDAISGGAWQRTLREQPENYLVCPPPRQVFGVRRPDGSVRQFELSRSPLHVVVLRLKRGVPEPAPRELPPLVQHVPGSERERSEDDLRLPSSSWEVSASAMVTISLVDPEEYRIATGRTLPPPPAPDERYTPRRFP